MADIKITLNLQDTEGKKVSKKLKVANAKVKTLKAGLSYEFGDLVSLAAKGKIANEVIERSPALKEMTQSKAIELVEDAYRSGNNLLVEDAVSKEEV